MLVRPPVLAAAFLLSAGAAAQCPLMYSNAVHSPGVADAADTAAGDFDGDGRVDIVTVARLALGIWVHWGLGDGTFEAPQQIFASSVADVAVGDFDEDGLPDIVAREFTSPQRIRILASRPNRTFVPQPFAPFATNSNMIDLSVGDIDGDGHLDVAGFTRSVPAIHVALGDGSGALAAHTSTPLAPALPQNPIAIVCADLDGRAPDEVVAAFSGSPDGARLVVARWNGPGVPLEIIDRHDLTRVLAVLAAGDLNGDGRSDVFAVAADLNNDASLTVFSGAEDGTLERERLFAPSAGLALAILPADVDGDGDLDVVVTNPTFRVWLNDGQGAMTETLYSTPVGFQTLCAGDFDRDGRVDLAFSTTGAAPTADVIPNAGPLAFVRPILDPIYTCPNGTFEVPVFITRMVNPPISWEFLGERGWTPILEGEPFQTPDGEVFGAARNSDTTSLFVEVAGACCLSSPVAQVRCLVTNPCGTTIGPPIRLIVCRPDFTCDGFLDFFDYDGFVDAYLAGGPSADFNADGFLDFFDYDDFVTAFEVGC